MSLWTLISASWLVFWVVLGIRYISSVAGFMFGILGLYLYLDGWNTLSFENDAIMIWFLGSIIVLYIRLRFTSKSLYAVSVLSVLGAIAFSCVGRMDKAFHMASWVLYFLALGAVVDIVHDYLQPLFQKFRFRTVTKL